MDHSILIFKGCVLPDQQIFDARPEQSLLDSVEQAGIYWPASCRSGTCRTCMAQLIEGQVRYEMEWPGLSAEEKREGWILPCVARPLGNVTLKDPLSD